MKPAKLKLSQTMEDYLETIFVVSQNRGYARTCEIAKNLQISPSSAVETVGRLASLNLVVWKRYEGVYLTPEGRIHGEIIHIRHEMLRRFFEFIGVPNDIANAEACIIEHELTPVTTAAIGNLVRFLQTPAGEKTCSSLKLFTRLQDAGIPLAEKEIRQEQVSSDEIQETIQRSSQQYKVLSTLTRHDLLNSLTALYGYLDLLKEQKPEAGTAEIVSRIEQTATSMYRQISGTGDLLIPGSSTRTWLDIGRVIDNAVEGLDTTKISIENNLHGVELHGDPLINKVIFNLLENAARHGKTVSTIRCGCFHDNSDLVIYISDDGTGIPDEEKHAIFRPGHGTNSGLGLYLSDQILSSCRMRIEESGRFGEGASFGIRVPPPLFRNTRMGCVGLKSEKEDQHHDPETESSLPVPEKGFS
nr:ATP-binding protein [uncultured Methanospirillum sp.]